MEVGTVKGFNPGRGFGFIASEAGGEISSLIFPKSSGTV